MTNPRGGRLLSWRGGVVLLAALAVASAIAAVLTRPPAARPNVVLIIIDTLRADALGCYDSAASGLSPEIDALAARGVVLRQVIAQSSWTRPSIGSLLSSRPPRSLGLYSETYDVLPDLAVTLAEALGTAGYETVGVTANPNINGVFGFAQGFDRYVDSSVVWSWMDPQPGQLRRSRRNRLPDARTIFGETLDHLRARAAAPRPAPVYLQITLMDVHEGWHLVRPEFRQDDHGRVGVPRGYWDAVRQVSHDVSSFVEELTALPGWEDTLFVVTSDHGQGLDDHPDVKKSWGHGFLLYGSQVEVPMIFYRSGGGLRSRVVEEPVRLLDLAPTILEFVGVEPPAGMDGQSFLPLILGSADTIPGLPSSFVSETRYQGADKIAVHTPAWTYIENRDGHEGLNPRELQPRGIRENGRLTDRIGDEPTVGRELEALLHDWERRHPEQPATQPSVEVSPEELEQLRTLGYVE